MTLQIINLCIPSAPTLSLKDHIVSARKHFILTRLRALPVVDESTEKYYGLVYRRKLLEVTATRTNARIKDLIEPGLTFYLNSSNEPTKVLHSMIKLGAEYAALLEDQHTLKFKCLLGLDSLLRHILDLNLDLLDKPLRSCMKAVEVVVNRKESVYSVWQTLRKHNLTAIPVVDSDEKLVGVVSEYDLLRWGFTRPHLESDNWASKGPRVEEIMSTPPLTFEPSDPIRAALSMMVKRGIGRVYIVDDSYRPVGLVDRVTLAHYYLRFAISTS